ncbi:unnamed protein product [Nesidiocoris tenuis]|uniref:Uncharacterized protein n=1 Tax=Nesidiocoris tenuis TaxID=355587 RepID=A0A6H5GPN0_9HEMI|nr:unnamed protein product [Nesidiocoris tenuis]
MHDRILLNTSLYDTFFQRLAVTVWQAALHLRQANNCGTASPMWGWESPEAGAKGCTNSRNSSPRSISRGGQEFIFPGALRRSFKFLDDSADYTIL